MNYQLNTIKVAFENYRYYLRGIKKSGKTTLYRDLILNYYKDPRCGLLISFGNETGYKSLDQLMAIEAPNWEKFIEIVDDLVENKKENNFKIICLDTIDELVSIARDKVLKIHFQRKNERCDSLNSALGGYNAGFEKLQELINDQIKRIESAGYGLMFLGHCKIRQIKEKGTSAEDGYSQLTSNLDPRFDSIFSDKADVIATIFSVKDVEDKKLLSAQRYIYFRSDNFVEAGGRFKNMPERIEYGAQEFIDAIEQGIKSSFSTPVPDKEIEKMKQKELEEKSRKADEFISKSKTSNSNELSTIEDYVKRLDEIVSGFNAETKSQKKAELKDAGLPANYKKETELETLKSILKIMSA